jgi:hypothetical protein
LYRFLAIAVLLDVKDIPQVGPLQWGRINRGGVAVRGARSSQHNIDYVEVMLLNW